MNEPFNYSGKLTFLRQACIDSSLIRTDLAVLAVMLDYVKRDTGVCFPSVATMVRESGVPRTTVLRSIKRLEDARWLSADRRNGASTRYVLTSPVSGTSPVGGTGATWNATGATQVLRTGPVHGTEAVPSADPQPEVKANQGKNQSARAKNEPSADVPAWLPAAAWQSWMDHRKQVGRKFTPHAQELSIKRLAELRGQGHDPKKLIDLAIESGWSSVNPRETTKATAGSRGLLPRDARSEEEIERANQAQLARFGLEVAV